MLRYEHTEEAGYEGKCKPFRMVDKQKACSKHI